MNILDLMVDEVYTEGGPAAQISLITKRSGQLLRLVECNNLAESFLPGMFIGYKSSAMALGCESVRS